MSNIIRTGLLVKIAKLYYEHDYSQQMIADKLGFSRPYVSKLIQAAKQSGIVEIKIHDPNETETQIEAELKERFNLHRAIVIPSLSGNGNVLEKLGVEAAKYLNNIIKDNDIIGVAWGSTLYECSQKIIRRDDLNNIQVVQLCGGISNIERNIYASEIPKNFSEAYRGIPYVIPLPAVVDNVTVKTVVLTDKNISHILNIAKEANIAIFTMGTIGHESALVRAGYISKNEVDLLIQKGAVGDICSRIIDIHGNICDEELNKRTVGVELEELKKKECRIGIAAGANKARCILGALTGGFINVLITDEETAESVMKM